MWLNSRASPQPELCWITVGTSMVPQNPSISSHGIPSCMLPPFSQCLWVASIVGKELSDHNHRIGCLPFFHGSIKLPEDCTNIARSLWEQVSWPASISVLNNSMWDCAHGNSDSHDNGQERDIREGNGMRVPQIWRLTLHSIVLQVPHHEVVRCWISVSIKSFVLVLWGENPNDPSRRKLDFSGVVRPRVTEMQRHRDCLNTTGAKPTFLFQDVLFKARL